MVAAARAIASAAARLRARIGAEINQMPASIITLAIPSESRRARSREIGARRAPDRGVDERDAAAPSSGVRATLHAYARSSALAKPSSTTSLERALRNLPRGAAEGELAGAIG